MSHSPSIQSPTSLLKRSITTMNFPQAITAIINDERISRLEWHDPDTYGMLRDGLLMLYLSDTKQWYKWIINDGDLLSEDWIVVK